MYLVVMKTTTSKYLSLIFLSITQVNQGLFDSWYYYLEDQLLIFHLLFSHILVNKGDSSTVRIHLVGGSRTQRTCLSGKISRYTYIGLKSQGLGIFSHHYYNRSKMSGGIISLRVRPPINHCPVWSNLL